MLRRLLCLCLRMNLTHPCLLRRLFCFCIYIYIYTHYIHVCLLRLFSLSSYRFNSSVFETQPILSLPSHDDFMKWKHFLRYWPFVRGIHRWPVNSPHKGKWRGALIFPLICAWTYSWANNGDAGDLRRHRAHYDVTLMVWIQPVCSYCADCQIAKTLGYFPMGLKKTLIHYICPAVHLRVIYYCIKIDNHIAYDMGYISIIQIL